MVKKCNGHKMTHLIRVEIGKYGQKKKNAILKYCGKECKSQKMKKSVWAKNS